MAAIARSLRIAPVLLALLAAACDRREPETAPVSPLPAGAAADDPCALLSDEEVGAATAIAAAGEAGTDLGAPACTWRDPGGKTVTLRVHGDPADFERARAEIERLYQMPAEPFTDLGEDAFVVSGTAGGFPAATAGVREGGAAVTVQVLGMGHDWGTLRNEAVGIARTVVRRMAGAPAA
jgi:hypothetical protein